jgi:DNA (cytosine-5)-methyltransferase 1
MAGNREKDWGKEKVFREGQAEQVLDTLFFDFIDLAKELQPKVVVAENVKGLLLGAAKEYVIKIYKAFDEAGYYCQHFLLDASKMGVPQRRERVFFICLRKDLAKPFLHWADMFTQVPKIELNFNEKKIVYSEIEDKNPIISNVKKSYSDLWLNTKPGCNFGDAHPKGHYFGEYKQHPNNVCNTIVANASGSLLWHYNILRPLNDYEYKLIGSYPLDYNFLDVKPKYLIGMSVPPVMIAQIASNIYDQWLSKL